MVGLQEVPGEVDLERQAPGDSGSSDWSRRPPVHELYDFHGPAAFKVPAAREKTKTEPRSQIRVSTKNLKHLTQLARVVFWFL